MRISTASLAFAALVAAPVITIAPSDAAGRDESPAQAEVLSQARKTWFKDNYQRRLDLLQSHQICVDAASSLDEFKMCRKDKKKARKSLKQDYRAYMHFLGACGTQRRSRSLEHCVSKNDFLMSDCNKSFGNVQRSSCHDIMSKLLHGAEL